MSWFSTLYETYQNVLDNPVFADGDNKLMPIGHTSQQVHIIVTIDGEGNFRRASFIEKEQMILPATEESAGRTSGRVAHPLIDQIKYCAGDYRKYSGNEGYFSSETLLEETRSKPQEKQPKTYIETLRGWVESLYGHPMAKAVYTYVSKGTLVSDLVREQILFLDEEGKLATVAQEGQEIPVFKVLQPKKVKIDGEDLNIRDQGNLMVAWQVEIPDELETNTWKSKSLQESWIHYNASQMDKKGLCMVSGIETLLANQHPRNIRRPGDGAKLISANDKSGFTYRGRFMSPEEACTVGYETSHKAHNALRWLIERQGYRNDTQVIIAWTPTGSPVPQPFSDLLDDEDTFPDFSQDNADTDNREILSENNTAVDNSTDMGQTFAWKLKKALWGYNAGLDEADKIAVLGLDSATPGRLSVTFYMEQFWQQYRQALENWQSDMSWWIRRSRETEGEGGKKKKTTVFWKETAPTPDEIARAAYGRRMDDKLKKQTIERLLPCIASTKQVPFDLVSSCVNRACNRAGLEKWEWETVLGIACAMYKGYCKRQPEKQRREYKVGLDRENTSRDYLYGRLLAIAERIERRALGISNEERSTNAERLMQRFADGPYTTWRQLEMAVQPYRQRLQQNPKTKNLIIRLDKLTDEIMSAFKADEFMRSGRLSGEFLLGYHCQRQDFFSVRESEKNENNQGENE